MESPSRSLTPSLPHSSTLQRRRTTTDSHPPNSPEFQFWRIPSAFPPSPLHSADELFSDGFLLPLHHLHQPPPDPNPKPDEPHVEESEQSQTISAAITSGGNAVLTASKRWKEIFKRGEKKTTSFNTDETVIKSEKKKKKEIVRNAGNGNTNSNTGSSGSGSAELNINLWPFSRSRSARNNSARTKPASVRKVSSAPCSRSNSSGDSKSRRSWPSSPGRNGVHLGRSSPVVQIRRTRVMSDDGLRKPANNLAGKSRGLNLNVPMCIGYRQQLSGDDAGSCGSGSNGNLFKLRGLFSKKSVLTA